MNRFDGVDWLYLALITLLALGAIGAVVVGAAEIATLKENP